ncbi:MAG: DUF5686 and carboxypeptidase regulatory-like domain-containing protein [Calditrichales bacterium]|nr:DUF5686 and carboxypeptidase regulatory-like domain-containing protein [Calditrichales bacterium]
MRRFYLIIFISLFILCLNNLFPQTIVHGCINDAHTMDPLPAANIQIENTLRGTITNKDGRFVLELKELPASILITYIGYESKRISFNKDSDKTLNIVLKPVIFETEVIIVSAEDPGMGIIREVIRRKIKWQKKLRTFQADAYTSLTLENDSGIVSISESVSTAFWDREKGPREVIKSKRQTNNMESRQNFATASHIPNLYDDDIEINGFQMIGVTHPSAFDYYDFKLIGKRWLDKKIVYDISVIPTSKLQPVFVGRISVLDKDFAMIDVDLKPNDAMLFPPPIQEWNLYYKQQFRNFGREFWLPVDVRIGGDIKVGFTGLQFPKIKYDQISHLTDYQVNIELPDSLYQEKKIISLDSAAIEADTLFTSKPEIIPLSEKEEEAYQELDSTMTLDKAFKPTGFLAKFAKLTFSGGDADSSGKKSSKSILPGFAPQLWFNRVDGFHLGFNYEKDIIKKLNLKLSAAYKTGIKKAGYAAGLKYNLGKKQAGWIKIKFKTGTVPRWGSDNYSLTVASLLPLFGQADYFDYYWAKSVHLQAGYRFKKLNTSIMAGLNNETHSSVSKYTDFNIIGSNYKQRVNPGIDEGELRSVEFALTYGDDYIPFGVLGQKRAELKIEHSSSKNFNSDFYFTRYGITIDWRINTFLKRRLMPNAFDIRFIGGLADGDLPLQRFGIIDANMYAFTPFGVLKTLQGRPYEGEKYAALFLEHNFRTVPFELLGLDYLARKGIGIILHGSLGRTWISKDRLQGLDYDYNYIDHFHQEAGVSINGLFGLFRFDLTRRLDRPCTYTGVSFVRFF